MVTEGPPVVMNDSVSGMGIWGVLIIALFLMGGFGNGFGGNGFANAIGYENLATSNEVQRGFDNQNSMSNQREILSAVNDASARGIATTNQVYHDVVSYVGDKYSELQRDVAGLAVGQANLLAKENECCCATLRAIDGVNYNNALNTASINAKTTEQTQKILDALSANKIESLQNKVNELSLAQALAGVVRYPMGTNYAVPSPCFGGCSCGM